MYLTDVKSRRKDVHNFHVGSKVRGIVLSCAGLALFWGCSRAPQAPPMAAPRQAATAGRPKPKTEAPAENRPPLQVTVDSAMSLEEALAHDNSPPPIHRRQRLVNVEYYSFDGKLHRGQVLVDKSLVEDIKQIFEQIKESRFPIAKVIPISRYGWSDDESVADDNSSGFNYRIVPATHHLSEHAYGRAIDLNPEQNPYEDPIRGTTDKYDPSKPGTLTRDSAPTVAFREHGWQWGGRWRRGRDYQHFEKR